MAFKKISVLLIEDNKGDIRLIQEYLSEKPGVDYQLRSVGSLAEALSELTQTLPDVILLDLSLPDSSGLKSLLNLKNYLNYIPIIILTGLNDQQLATEAVNYGAQDYLLKSSLQPELLVKAIQYAISRKQVEKALYESELRYKSIIEDQSELICRFLHDYTVSFANTGFCNFFEHKIDELVGYPFLFDLSDKDRVLFQDKLELLSSSSPMITIDHEINAGCRKGSWIQWHLRKIFDQSENIIEISAVGRDITELKQSEQALVNANDEMEQKVIERTKELKKTNHILQQEINERKLIESQLNVAIQDADIANKAKSEFLANMSHELRTPMHGILSFSRFGVTKIDRLNREKTLHYFKRIAESADRLMMLLNDLLDLSKLESGKMDYQFSEVKIEKLVKNSISEFQSLLEDKNTKIDIQKPDFSTSLICDEFKIGQVIRNLLSNAVKFTAENSLIQIFYDVKDIQFIADEKPIPTLIVNIKDQGVGIPNEELEAIFDKFTQSSKTNLQSGGTGLGLAICREIVHAHFGNIWATNNPEGGVTFSVMIPFRLKQFKDALVS